MDVEPIIRGVDAHKVYNSGAVKVHALRGVNLAIPRGEMVAIMTAVELDGWADHKPAQLSAGQQQRVAIARALVNDPAIVWADEPTGNLDSETSVQIMDLLVRLNREQRQTLVLVTHDAAVSSRAHRILRMRNGEIVEETRGG